MADPNPMGMGGDRVTVEAQIKARENEHSVLELAKRGINFRDIAKQLGYADASGARKAYHRALARIPKAEAEEIRKVMSDRFQDYRARIHRLLLPKAEEVPDPKDPKKKITVNVDPSASVQLFAIDRLIRIDAREARLFGLDAPRKLSIEGSAGGIGGIGSTDVELREALGRLTPDEQKQLMYLIAKARGVSPTVLSGGGGEQDEQRELVVNGTDLSGDDDDPIVTGRGPIGGGSSGGGSAGAGGPATN